MPVKGIPPAIALTGAAPMPTGCDAVFDAVSNHVVEEALPAGEPRDLVRWPRREFKPRRCQRSELHIRAVTAFALHSGRLGWIEEHCENCIEKSRAVDLQNPQRCVHVKLLSQQRVFGRLMGPFHALAADDASATVDAAPPLLSHLDLPNLLVGVHDEIDGASFAGERSGVGVKINSLSETIPIC